MINTKGIQVVWDAARYVILLTTFQVGMAVAKHEMHASPLVCDGLLVLFHMAVVNPAP